MYSNSMSKVWSMHIVLLTHPLSSNLYKVSRMNIGVYFNSYTIEGAAVISVVV